MFSHDRKRRPLGVTLTALAVGAALALTGCAANGNGGGEAEGDGDGGNLAITFLPKNLGNPYFDTSNAGGEEAIEEFGVEHVAGITVGNEYLLNGGPADALITKMAAMRTMLAGMNLGKTIPVGTADAGSMVTTSLGAGSDYVMANVSAACRRCGECPR